MNPSLPPSSETAIEANEKRSSRSKATKNIHRNDRGDQSWRTYSNQWKANHGTMFVVFTGLIWLVGSALLFYRQNRFRPPSFPSSGAYQQPRQSGLPSPELDTETQSMEVGDAVQQSETNETTLDQPSRDRRSDTPTKTKPTGKSESSTDPKEKTLGKPASQDQSRSRLRTLEPRTQTVSTKAVSASKMRFVSEANSAGSTLSSDGDAPVFTIRIVGASANPGSVRVAVYPSKETFRDAEKALLKKTIEVSSDGMAKWIVPIQMLPKQFAVAAYHDVNDDKQLNKNGFGIPMERYGYSNDARGNFGPPGFDEAVVDRPNADESLDFRLW